jgi:Domain of unknown function (DUF4405)
VDKTTDSKREPSSPIKLRTIISLITTWLFLVLGTTGLILYIMPHGRIAYWVDWHFLGFTKNDWGEIHLVSSILFLVAGGWHLYFNWRAFLGHLRRRLKQGMKMRTELSITVAFTLFVVASALWHIPPLSYLIVLNETIKNSWIEDSSYEPPFGHAELLSFKRFCKKTGIDPKRASARLDKAGIHMISSSETLEEIARNNSISPKDVFAVIKDLKETKTFEKIGNSPLTTDDVFERFDRTGIGRKTVSETCTDGGEEISICLERLRRKNIDADSEENLKPVANRAGSIPIKILQIMLVDQ